MESIWRQDTAIGRRERLRKDRTVKAAVIGAGMAGVLTAYRLKQKGFETVCLEADRIGSGQTQNTTAKITSQHGLIYQNLVAHFTKEQARQYAAANEGAIQDYEDLVNALSVDCGFRREDAYLYSMSDEKILEEEAKAALYCGIKTHITRETTLPFEIKSALRFEGQASFHPLRFLEAVADEIEVYENTPVTGVEDGKIYTPEATVKTEYVVFATHYPFINVPGYYFLRMHQERSYVLALKNTMELNGMYYGIDEPGAWSLRKAGDTLLFGGSRHRTGENKSGGKYEMLKYKAKEFWPESSIVSQWSAQDCITLDQVPYIGQYSVNTPNWFVATGFGKWGMTSSMAAANIISGLIAKQETGAQEEVENAGIFSPQRFVLSASAKTLYQDSLHATKGLTKGMLSNPPRCPHMGCQLEWNPDEESWDCPCHGSRFDVEGKLLNGPAQKNLDKI